MKNLSGFHFKFCNSFSQIRASPMRSNFSNFSDRRMREDWYSGTVQPCARPLTVTVRHGSSLSVRRLSVGLRRGSSSAAFCHIKDVRCETNLQQLWRQVFAAADLKPWNSLPAELRQADISFQQFKRLLKTFLFVCWDRGALWLTVKPAPHKFTYLLTYLLTQIAITMLTYL